ncbi:MAG: signal recognition particle protein [Holosporales bacterium]|jgi:signal recognition particle subunit SRP54|nr:signal recognition particle protein [Holosporales bacterium]
MFSSLSQKLSSVFDRLRGKGYLNEEDIDKALRDIRIALIEADVALPAIKALVACVREKAVGHEVFKSVTPGQMVVKLVHDEIVSFLGEQAVPLDLKANSPFSYLFVGLQGAGKTTSVAKIAKHLKDSRNVLTVSLDVYRPAAQTQLAVLSDSIGVRSLPIVQNERPLTIAKRAMQVAKKENIDVILFDTAGRLHVDDEMMKEVAEIHKLVEPVETLLTADSMMGQEAVNVAKAFNELVPLTGLILTRADGDARGGAILSMRFVTGCPVKFLGTGEHVDKLVPFDPRRVADQIFGMGDIVQLVETAEKISKGAGFDKLQKRLEKGLFNLNDMREQIELALKMDGLSGIIGSAFKQAPKIEDPNKKLLKDLAFIQSMTPKERFDCKILNASRRKRIAAGAGQTVAELNKFIKSFELMQNFVKRASKDKAKVLLDMFKGQTAGPRH